jgi:hypothetical protein
MHMPQISCAFQSWQPVVRRANGMPQTENCSEIETPDVRCAPAGVIARNVALLVDAGMRGWMSE